MNETPSGIVRMSRMTLGREVTLRLINQEWLIFDIGRNGLSLPAGKVWVNQAGMIREYISRS